MEQQGVSLSRAPKGGGLGFLGMLNICFISSFWNMVVGRKKWRWQHPSYSDKGVMEGQIYLCPKGLNPAPSFQPRGFSGEGACESKQRRRKVCFPPLLGSCSVWRISDWRQCSAGGKGIPLRKVLNVVLICREVEFLPGEEGLSVQNPSFADASSRWVWCKAGLLSTHSPVAAF